MVVAAMGQSGSGQTGSGQSGAGPQTNSSVIDADGTAHITRVVPVPSTISPQAQASLRNNYPDKHQTLAERRSTTDTWQNGAGGEVAGGLPGEYCRWRGGWGAGAGGDAADD